VIRTAGHVTASQPSSQRLAPGTMDLKGHGFSRDASATETDAALAAEGMLMIEKIFPRGLKPSSFLRGLMARLKPCPFKTVDFLLPSRHSAAEIYRAFLLCVTVALVAVLPARADAPASAPPAQPASHGRDASMEEYRGHLQALKTIVEACAKARDKETCDPALVGEDDHVAITQSADPTAVSDRRLVRYGWLRTLLTDAQEKDKAPDKSDAKPAADAKATPSTQPEQPCDCSTSGLLKDAETRLDHDIAQTNEAKPAAAVHPQEREAMKQVLAGRDFSNLEEPRARETILRKIGAWLNWLLEGLSRAGSTSVWIGRAILWGFILAVCVGLVWGLMQLERRWAYRLVPENAGPAAGAASARDWQLWLEDARKAAAAGQWREAVHFVYWASISRLESRRLWPADRARTPREYLALVAPEDPRKPGLASLTGSFERIWYGGRPAAESDYRNAEQLATGLISGSGATANRGGAAQ